MEERILAVHYPRGSLPARGWRCPVCGHERIGATELARLEEIAHSAALFGIEREQTRTLIKSGNSVAVTLDRELLRAIGIPDEPGTRVKVGRVGDRIVVGAGE